MKYFITLFAFCFATASWACPDLSGNFLCAYGDKLEIQQSESNGVTTYNMSFTLANGEVYSTETIADGKVHTLPDDPRWNGTNRKYKFYCSNESVIGYHEANYKYNDGGNGDWTHGFMHWDATYGLDSDKNFVAAESGYFEEEGRRQNEASDTTCIRQ